MPHWLHPKTLDHSLTYNKSKMSWYHWPQPLSNFMLIKTKVMKLIFSPFKHYKTKFRICKSHSKTHMFNQPHPPHLYKLKQTWYVHDYKKKKKKLNAFAIASSPFHPQLFLIVLFLDWNLKYNMIWLSSTSQAIRFAKLIESKNVASKPYQHYSKNNPKPDTTLIPNPNNSLIHNPQ